VLPRLRVISKALAFENIDNTSGEFAFGNNNEQTMKLPKIQILSNKCMDKSDCANFERCREALVKPMQKFGACHNLEDYKPIPQPRWANLIPQYNMWLESFCSPTS
jgi:hypothetical protein